MAKVLESFLCANHTHTSLSDPGKMQKVSSFLYHIKILIKIRNCIY